MGIKYTNTLSVADYNRLRGEVGWLEIEPEQAGNGLCGSAYIVAAMDGERTVGMARMFTDGGYIAFIADVVVLPEYQGMAIGKTMIEMIVAHIKNGMKKGQKITVNLMSASGREGFYEKLGFCRRPNETYGAGMTMRLDCDE